MTKILIVDDREDVRDLLEATLRRGKYEIMSAASGQEALEVAADRRPAVIIMDVLMPGSVDGIQATRILKSDDRTKGSKILILTGKETDQIAEEAVSAGADAYLAKPFSPLALLQTVDYLAGYPSGGRCERIA